MQCVTAAVSLTAQLLLMRKISFQLVFAKLGFGALILVCRKKSPFGNRTADFLLLRTEKTRLPMSQTLPNLLLKALQFTNPTAGLHLYWYQTWRGGNTLTGLAWQTYSGKAWVTLWHHTGRNLGQEPRRCSVATAGFPTRSSLCQEKCLGAAPWDTLNPASLMGMGWDSLHPSQPLHF